MTSRRWDQPHGRMADEDLSSHQRSSTSDQSHTCRFTMTTILCVMAVVPSVEFGTVVGGRQVVLILQEKPSTDRRISGLVQAPGTRLVLVAAAKNRLGTSPSGQSTAVPSRKPLSWAFQMAPSTKTKQKTPSTPRWAWPVANIRLAQQTRSAPSRRLQTPSREDISADHPSLTGRDEWTARRVG